MWPRKTTSSPLTTRRSLTSSDDEPRINSSTVEMRGRMVAVP
jgi:hypothetical protein